MLDVVVFVEVICWGDLLFFLVICWVICWGDLLVFFGVVKPWFCVFWVLDWCSKMMFFICNLYRFVQFLLEMNQKRFKRFWGNILVARAPCIVLWRVPSEASVVLLLLKQMEP